MFIKKTLGIFTLMIITSSFAAMAQTEIRKINPPKLEKANIGRKILCHRPMRHGPPKMEVEEKNGKVIAHNYGHGGAGWTLAPAATFYVNNLLLNSSHSKNLEKDTEITIIGAGVIGLFTAYDLVEKGFSNINIIADKFDSLASHNAGAILAPYSMDNDPETKKIINQLANDSYKFYQSIVLKKHQHFKAGARIIPGYFENKDEDIEVYVGKVMKPAKSILLDFGNGTKRNMVVYDDAIFVDTLQIMDSITNYLKNKKVKFKQAKIYDFNEIDSKFIINCTGLGAKELNDDSKLESVQGHLITLKEQNSDNLQYLLFIDEKEAISMSGHKAKRLLYVMPKHLPYSGPNDVGVIGGTFIEGATDETPNEEEFDLMIERARKFYGIEK